jgi:hypothetical protein
MVMLTIKTDFQGVQNRLNQISADLQKRVIPAALNKTIAKANTSMVREITSTYNIKAVDVRARLRVIRATKDFKKWKAILDPFAGGKRGRALNVIKFAEKKITLAEGRRRAKAGTADQLRFQIKKIGGKKTIQGAFIGNKGRTIFERTGDARLPIKPVTTIDVPQMFNTRRINAVVVKRNNDELAIEFDRAIRAAMTGSIR